MTNFTHWTYHVDEQNIGWLELDVAGSSVNILRREVMAEWAELMTHISQDGMLAGLCLLSGKERGFVYGADIAEFGDLKSDADVHELIELADRILSAVEALPCPTVCGIDGVAVGGGLEIALAFDKIVVTGGVHTRLGFPEIHLGIMPGYGGTGRALRRIKAEQVLDMVLSGRLLGAQEALSWGLVDTVVDNADQLQDALEESLKKPPVPDLQQTDAEVEAAILQVEETVLPRFRSEQTPAPFLICDHLYS
ncbi:MAG: enoyl-CoA hydratase-related protein [Pseudomonadota bacterium]|nr:enoyl-CoA hydratase-related protein [Pseudomonadota bacterium]